MLEDFLSYILEDLSINKADKLLLAISGGVDSMVMLDLFFRSDFDIEVAHINHSTRNGKSDQDEIFVIETCKELAIPCHTKVLEYEQLAKGNFQANARKARYAYFDSIIDMNHIDYLATAHHMDDRWETFAMNLNRKSGISGLTSLKSKVGKIIRPLLCFTKEEIEKYALDHNVKFAEDATNHTDDYTRNKIRHHMSEAAKEIFPDFIKNVNKSISNLDKTNNMIDNLILSGGYVSTVNQKRMLDLERVRANGSSVDLLYYLISTDGFTHSDAYDIINTRSTGALFYSITHEALYDRGTLIIRPRKERIENHIQLSKAGTYTLQDGRDIKFSLVTDQDEQDDCNISYPMKDNDSIIIRSIRPGDKFKPERMHGKTKTLKKLLGDQKVDRFTKEDLLVLEVNGEIKKIIGLNN